MEKKDKVENPATTDLSRENSISYKTPFYEIDKKNHPDKRVSQISLLKLSFDPSTPKLMIDTDELNFFQKLKFVQGPGLVDRFHLIGQQEKRTAMEDFIISNSNSQTKVLDAGCNGGIEGYRLYSRGFTGLYHGVDNNLKALTCAMDNLEGSPASFTLSDLSNINFPDNYFDIIFTKGVLEGLEYYETVLKELCRLTSKFLIMSPYIHMTDEPDLIRKEPNLVKVHGDIDVYANRYNRKKMFNFLNNLGLQKPNVIYSKNDPELGIQEIITFEKNN